ncbi:hypothetical protein ACH46N_15020 [Streptomyces pristinaespiralis]|uniref:Uncharacterized protein n=2 Tax=Streptomyces pristinaespiralis TaxID=38300 RepID=B5H8R9_STRE2|nr:hypothetical protein [Streptomyces pristinaespiralis]ALC20361.1 RNA polymerase sigma factor FliA/WhiG family [Streptomyces pristinaespiralis]EDY63230.1 conserved hypothetical protein [Streptomyces pristinaespiralis ATCC 25486]QMU16773.1 hypothetical protein H3L99_26745 [Streptomyces pristinaespiralis]
MYNQQAALSQPSEKISFSADCRLCPARLSCAARTVPRGTPSARWDRERRTASPYDREWITTELKEFAQRAETGEQLADLQEELLARLWPWAKRTADRLASGLPAEADRDAVRSEVMWELYQSILRIDWTRYEVWPALLRARIRGAFTAAARAEDPLTRGQRRARRQFLALEEATVQGLGRMLTPGEKAGLASRVSPKNGELLVLLGFQRPASIDDVELSLPDPAQDPEGEAIRRCSVAAFRSWLENDLPPDLARYLSESLRRDTGSLPAGVRRRLTPYLPALRLRLADPVERMPCPERNRHAA